MLWTLLLKELGVTVIDPDQYNMILVTAKYLLLIHTSNTIIRLVLPHIVKLQGIVF